MAVTAKQMVERYIEAEMAVLEGRSVTFNGRTLTMADLSQIREGRKEWERRAVLEVQSRRGGGQGYSLAEFS